MPRSAEEYQGRILNRIIRKVERIQMAESWVNKKKT